MAATPHYNHRQLIWSEYEKKKESEAEKLRKLKATGQSCRTCIHQVPTNPQTGSQYFCTFQGHKIMLYNLCSHHNEPRKI